MSTWYSEDLTCPACGHAFTAQLARGIHASRLPALRATILRGDLHRPTCPGCHQAIEVRRHLAYTDFDRGHWVQVAQPTELARWAELEAGALELFDRALLRTAPAAAALAARFAVRVVFDYDELREKLMLWDAGADDAIVECIKLRCLRERPDLVAGGQRLRVRGVAMGRELTMAAAPAAQPRAEVATWTVPSAWYTAIDDDRVTWAQRYPELFRPGFVGIDRYLRG